MARIWTWWSSGEETLTPFLQLCLKSWRVKHPEWQVVVLDSANLWQYLTAEDLPSTFTQIQRASLQSDLVRLAILAKYGGCYVDMSSLATQPAAEMAWARIGEGACLVGFRAPHFIPDFVSAWFLAAPQQEPIVVEWSKMFNHVMEGRVDDRDIHHHSFFEGVDLSDYLRYGALAPKPGQAASLWVEYLVVNVVLKAVLDKDPSLKQRFWSSSCLVLESDPNLSPTLWSESQVHLIPEDVVFPENEKLKMQNLLKQDPDFATRLMDLPMVKFFNSGSPYAHLSSEELLASPSVLGCLIRKALGSLVDASQSPAQWPQLPALKDLPNWPTSSTNSSPFAWTSQGRWTRPEDLAAERVAVATVVTDRCSAVAARSLARSLKKATREGTAYVALVPEPAELEVCHMLEVEGWQVIPVQPLEFMILHLWNLPWDRVLYIDANAIAVGDLQQLLYSPEMEPPKGGVAMSPEYCAAMPSEESTAGGTPKASSSSSERFVEDAVTVASTSMLDLKNSEAMLKVSGLRRSPGSYDKAQAAAAFKENGYCHAGVVLLRPSSAEFQRLLEVQRLSAFASMGDLLHEVYTKRGLTKILRKGYNAQKWLRICAPELWQTLDLKIISFCGTKPWLQKGAEVVECLEGENSACQDLVRLWHQVYH